MVTTIFLVLSVISLLVLLLKINKIKKTSNMHWQLYMLFVVILCQVSGLLMQDLFAEKFNIDPIKFEYVGYIGAFITPLFLIFALEFFGKKVSKIMKSFIYTIPVMSLIIVWTNDFHHLFYEQYSINFSEQVTGAWFSVHSIYSYICIAVGMYTVIRATLKKSGFFSAQTLFIILGCLCPLIPNLLATMGVVNMTVYVTPIMFSLTAICFYIAVIKLKALNVIPIATKTIIDNMTDSFIVISEDGTIADINKTCIEKFAPLMELKQNDNLYDKLKGKKTLKLEDLKNDIKEAIDKKSTITKEYHIQKNEYDKYFEVDIQPIKAKSGNEYVAMLLLIRDVTQAKKDIEIITKNENLVILGELAGGVAHDINTPISAIKSGVTMLKTVSKSEDEQMLLSSMDRCADKIIALVNSLRNQIRNIGSDTVTDISITNTLSDIKLILNNELKKNNVELVINTENEINIKGNPTKLSQVITNIVTNAIQAYDKQGGKVEVTVKEEKNNAVIFVKDYASGIPESVRPYIFKNILTTKGVSGTGFGLYLAYSVIKGAFGGDITFETETGKGTTFIITLPIK